MATVQHNALGISARGTGTTFYPRAADGTLISQRTPDEGGRRNYLYDGDGSVVGLTDSYGQLRTSYRYDPYGHPQNKTSTGDENPFGYGGAYMAGLGSDGVLCGGVYMGPRGLPFDPEDGRFTANAVWSLPMTGGSALGVRKLAPRSGSLLIKSPWRVLGVKFGVAFDFATGKLSMTMAAGVGTGGPTVAYSTASAGVQGVGIIGGGCIKLACIDAGSRPGGAWTRICRSESARGLRPISIMSTTRRISIFSCGDWER